jgi:hypothetical protein
VEIIKRELEIEGRTMSSFRRMGADRYSAETILRSSAQLSILFRQTTMTKARMETFAMA